MQPFAYICELEIGEMLTKVKNPIESAKTLTRKEVRKISKKPWYVWFLGTVGIINYIMMFAAFEHGLGLIHLPIKDGTAPKMFFTGLAVSVFAAVMTTIWNRREERKRWEEATSPPDTPARGPRLVP